MIIIRITEKKKKCYCDFCFCMMDVIDIVVAMDDIPFGLIKYAAE